MDQFRPREDQNPVRDLQRGVEDIKDLMDRFLKGRGTWLIILILLVLYLLSSVYIIGQEKKGLSYYSGSCTL
jgi:hypothetical protein